MDFLGRIFVLNSFGSIATNTCTIAQISEIRQKDIERGRELVASGRKKIMSCFMSFMQTTNHHHCIMDT